MSIISPWQNWPAQKPPIVPAMLVLLMALIPGSLPNARPPNAQATDGLTSTSDTIWQLLDDFDGVQRSWHIPPRESLLRVLSHRRTDQSSRHGLRCEYIAVLAAKGDEKIYATHPIPPSMAIGEFRASVWLRGNRPGFQLLARLRLPRTLDPKTGEPISLLAEGDAYVTVGSWQRLSLDHVDQALANKTRALRAELGRHVDPAEAYVDLVVLNIYGGAGTNRLWVDDLMVAGVVRSRRAMSDQVQQVSFHAHVSAPRVQVEHGLLLINEQAWMPRIVHDHGEPFHLLEQLGFNCVWLIHPATDRQISQARKHNLWLICPAPAHPVDLENFDRVLAWCVGRDVTSGEIANIRVQAGAIRARDVRARPLMISARDHHDVWSRYVDIVVDTGPAGVSRSRSGYPIWKTISLHGPDNDLSWLHVRNQAHQAITSGYQGVVVSTRNNLEQPSSRRQRQLMELLNMEFEVLQPWAVINQFDAVQETSNAGEYSVTVLRNGHTQLALVRKHNAHIGTLAINAFTDVVIPTSRSQAAFLVETDRLSPLTPRRTAGGVGISLPTKLTSAKILFTDQANVIRHLTQQLRRTAPRALELLLDTARAEVLELDRMIGHFGRSDAGQARLRTRLHQMHNLLPPSTAPAEQRITSRQLETVFWDLAGLRRTLRDLERTRGKESDESSAGTKRPPG